MAPSELSVTLSLFLAAAGAGLLSYSWMLMQVGVVTATAFTVFFAAATALSDFVFIQTAAVFREGCSSEASATMEGLTHAVLGRTAARWVSATVIIGCLGGAVGYLIVIGDLSVAPLRRWAGCDAAGGSTGVGCSFFATREAVIPLVAFAVALPLASLRSLGALVHSSALGALTVFAVAGVLIAQGAAALCSGATVSVVAATGGFPSDDAPDAVVLSRWAITPLMLGAPIAIFSLGNHTQVVPVYLELPPSSPAARRIARCVCAAVTTCIVLYMATGLAGYYTYKRTTHGDVLLDMPDGAATDAAKALLCAHVVFAFPILVFPARQSLRHAAAALAQRAPPASTARRVWGAAATATLPAAAVLTLIAAVCAVAIPEVAVVFGLLGATIATAQSHFLPGLLLLRWANVLEGSSLPPWPDTDSTPATSEEGVTSRERGAAAARAWATVRSVYGGRAMKVGAAEEGNDGTPLLSGGHDSCGASLSNGSGGSGNDDNGHDNESVLTTGGGGGDHSDTGSALSGSGAVVAADASEHARLLLPHILATSTPWLLRAQAWALMVGSVAVMLVGTGAFVFSTWVRPG